MPAPQFGHLVLPHLCWFGATQHSRGVACLVLAEMGCVWSSRASFSRPLSRCSISWSSIRSWGLSSGAANSVALGATVSPACFQDRRHLSRCLLRFRHGSADANLKFGMSDIDRNSFPLPLTYLFGICLTCWQVLMPLYIIGVSQASVAH